jgi:hypothetical protein
MSIGHARPSIAFAGSLAQKPGRGGHTWVFLQYLLGFKRLGWDVLFIDSLEPEMCVDEAGARVPVLDSWNVRYLKNVMCRFGLGDSFALLVDGGTRTVGMRRSALLERLRASSALINVMGYLQDEEVLAAAARRIFLDIDPGFGQMWQALGLHDVFHGHDAFVTIGERIGQSSCAVPTCGLDWITTRQPVVLDEWPAAFGLPSGPTTSIVSWRGAYGPITYQGKEYGLRPREFRKFAALPKRAGGCFELALDIHPADERDSDLLRSNGWALVPAREVTSDPWQYREYVRKSAAEVMIAKNMYVETSSGWVSDRSICYLASGRPVLAQDTGLDGLLPTGEGLLTFTTLDEAIDAVRGVRREAERHQRAARRLAEEYFDSAKVLGALADKLCLS